MQKVPLVWCPVASKLPLCLRYVSFQDAGATCAAIRDCITRSGISCFFVCDFTLMSINPMGLQQRPQSLRLPSLSRFWTAVPGSPAADKPPKAHRWTHACVCTHKARPRRGPSVWETVEPLPDGNKSVSEMSFFSVNPNGAIKFKSRESWA